MYVMDNKANPTDHEFFLMFNILTASGSQTIFYDSDVPIQCYTSAAELCEEVEPIVKTLNEQCGLNNFKCFEFEERDFAEGIKRFKVEAHPACDFEGATTTCVRLDEISDEIT